MSAHRRNLSLLIVFGILAVCYLPVLAPVARASGFSYVFHYNNRVGSFLLILLLAVVAIYVRRYRLQLPPPTLISAPAATHNLMLPVSLAVTLFAALGIWWLAAPGGGFYESSYFIDRLQLLLTGRHIYTGFEFVYGSLMLYAPAWLCRAFALSPANGYYFFWTLTLLAGTPMLWWIVQRFELNGISVSTAVRTRIFLLLWLYQLLQVATAGLNYSVLRVTLPFALLLAFHHTAAVHRHASTLLIAAAGLALLLATSPEQGLAFAFATLLYLPLRRWAQHEPVFGLWLFLLPLYAVEFAFASHTGTFITLRDYSIGGDCFPIYLNPYTLVMFAALLLVAAYIGAAPLRERLLPNSAPLLLYACAAFPAAFGRCEPLHLMDNGIAVILCAFLLVSQWPRLWRSSILVYTLLFLVYSAATMPAMPLFGRTILTRVWANGGPHGAFARRIDSTLRNAAIRHYGVANGQVRLHLLRTSLLAKAAPGEGALAGATPVVEAPFLYLPNTLGSYQGPLVDTGYYSGTLNLHTPAHVQRKIDELAAHPDRDVIVRWEAPKLCVQDIPDSRAALRRLLITPVLLPAVHEDDVFQPLCAYIQTHYQMVHPSSAETSGYSLWRPNSQ